MNSLNDYPKPQEISDHYVHEIHLLFNTIPEKYVPFEVIRKFNYEYDLILIIFLPDLKHGKHCLRFSFFSYGTEQPEGCTLN